MDWPEIQSYFDELVSEARRVPPGELSRRLTSMRFAAMCLLLGVEPGVARQRLRELARRENDLRKAC